jgi:hypothetical protein
MEKSKNRKVKAEKRKMLEKKGKENAGRLEVTLPPFHSSTLPIQTFVMS